MKALLVVGAGVIAATAYSRSPTDDALIAAMKLNDQPNYGWTTSITDDVRTYDIEGKTVRGDWTWLRLPIVKSIAERLGPDAGTETEAIFKGSDTFVIRTTEGSKTLPELPQWVRPPRPSGGRAGSSGNARTPFIPGGGLMVVLHGGPRQRKPARLQQCAIRLESSPRGTRCDREQPH